MAAAPLFGGAKQFAPVLEAARGLEYLVVHGMDHAGMEAVAPALQQLTRLRHLWVPGVGTFPMFCLL